MRRRERGRLASNNHFTPGKKSWATDKKKGTIMAGLFCWVENILSSFSSWLSKFRNVKSLYENGFESLFEKINFMKLGHKTSDIISHCEILKPSKQDLWSHSCLFNLENVIQCVINVHVISAWKTRLTECLMSLIIGTAHSLNKCSS